MDDWLRRAAAAQRAAMERRLADLEVTPAQFSLLCLIVEQPGVSAAELARRERLTPPTVSVTVANLEKRGWIRRVPDPEHARIQRLTATPSGCDSMDEGVRRTADWRRRLAATPTKGESDAVAAWLKRVAQIDI